MNIERQDEIFRSEELARPHGEDQVAVKVCEATREFFEWYCPGIVEWVLRYPLELAAVMRPEVDERGRLGVRLPRWRTWLRVWQEFDVVEWTEGKGVEVSPQDEARTAIPDAAVSPPCAVPGGALSHGASRQPGPELPTVEGGVA